MTNFLVEWQIEVEAETPEAAARMAQEIMRDQNSLASVFNVYAGDPLRGGRTIDLAEIDQEKTDG